MFDDLPIDVPDDQRGGGARALPPLGYQARDERVVDYGLRTHEATGLLFRGRTAPDPGGRHVTCVGAAQTFGCLCEAPWPRLLGAALGRPVLNLGYGGAGPRFFLDHPPLIETMNAGSLVVLQVMSGRSESNALFDARGLEQLTRRSDGAVLSAERAYADLFAAYPPRLPGVLGKASRLAWGPAPLRRTLRETKERWSASMTELIDAMRVPVVLLWFAKRPPWRDATKKASWTWQRYDGSGAALGGFPHLIGPRELQGPRAAADAYVQAVSSRGSPHPLTDRRSGERVFIDYGANRPELAHRADRDDYYPSPQMHADAAAALAPTCRGLLDRVSP